MKSLNHLHPRNPKQGFQFPGVFEITATGKANIGLENRVPRLLSTLGLNVLTGSLSSRLSSAGNYVAVRVSFMCPTREKYEEAHRTLRADPDIRWTL